MENKKNTSIDTINNLIERCYKNTSFKDKLVNDTDNTIRELYPDFYVEEGKKIVIEDQTDSNIVYLNIPKEPNLDELELTDEQLEMVSGGTISLLVAYAILEHEGPLINFGDTVIINTQIGDNNQAQL